MAGFSFLRFLQAGYHPSCLRDLSMLVPDSERLILNLARMLWISIESTRCEFYQNVASDAP